MLEPKSLEEALEILIEGKPIVVSSNDDNVMYLEYFHKAYHLTQYDKTGELLGYRTISRRTAVDILKKQYEE